jgi:hypothetical protein
MKPELHLFERDLKNKPIAGSNEPPRTIRAKNLDDNNKKLTLLQGAGDPPLYEVEYTTDGTRITRILPNGRVAGDLLSWDGSAWQSVVEPSGSSQLLYWTGKSWQALPAPNSSALQVLTIQNGTFAWTATTDCDE